jgi:hypothetical protein
MEAPRRNNTALDDDNDLDFWGRPSSPSQQAGVLEDESESDESTSDEEMEDDGDDDDDEEDGMDLFGHR